MSVMRTHLVNIANTIDANNPTIKAFVKKLQTRGVYTEATADEIDEFDEIEEALYNPNATPGVPISYEV